MRRLATLLVCALACSRQAEQRPLAVRVAVVGDLSPLGDERQTATSLAEDWVFEALVTIDESGDLAPKLASQIERLEGGRYRLKLRDGARFADGAPVLVEDVRAALVRAEPRARVRPEGDKLIVEVDGEQNDVALLLLRTLVTRQTPAGKLGTGPFRLVSQSSRSMVLARSEARRGHIETVELRSFDTPVDAAARTLAGEADVLPLLPSHMIEFFAGVERLKVVREQGQRAEALMFNARTLDRSARRALASELSETDASEVETRDGCKPIPEPAPAAIAPSGRSLRLIAPVQDATARRVALAMRRALGVRGEALSISEPAQVFAALRENRVDLVFMSILVAPRSMLVQHFHTGGPFNSYGYSNPAVDAAFDRSDWAAAEAAMRDDPPALWLCKPQQIAVVASQFKNARLGPYGLFETLPEWEVAQ